MRIPCADELTDEPITWLWPYRLAPGKLAALDGHPGVGKSWLALDLCARISTGRPLPDGTTWGRPPGVSCESAGQAACSTTPRAEPAQCLVLSGEESGADIRRRLRLLGADLKRVFVFSALDPGMDIEDLRWPTRRDTWNQIFGDLHPVLTVVDPIYAFLSSHAASSEIRLRAAMLPLQCLAERHRTCPLLVRHLAKVSGGPAVTRGLGPIGLSGVCRSTWLVAPDPHAPTERQVFAPIKNNLAGPQPSLAFSLQSAVGSRQEPVGSEQAAGGSARQAKVGNQEASESLPNANCPLPTANCPLIWHGPTDWTAEQLLGHRLPKLDALSPRERARELLVELLAAGPRPVREIWAVALKRGISDKTLDRVKDKMKIKHCRVVVDGRQRTFWHFKNDAPPANVVQPEGAAILEPWLKPQIERFAKKGPLEEE